MFDDSNATNQSLFRKETTLTTGYEPDKPVGRNKEVQRIADALRPLKRRKEPENLLIHGPSGIGKTTYVKYVFKQLENQTRVKTVYINCWQYNTRSSLLTELLIQLGYPAPRKGKPVDELLSKLREWLNKNRGVAIALDEIDQLDEPTEVIYDLQLLNRKAKHPIGVVMISNKPPSNLQLDPRTQSRINYQPLHFEPYQAQQIESILEKRVEQAFHPGSVKDTVIEEIAKHVAENNGDCREALELLLRAGRKADQEGRSEVSLDEIR